MASAGSKQKIVFEELFPLKRGAKETIRQLIHMTLLRADIIINGASFDPMIHYLYFLDGLERSIQKYEESRGFIKHQGLKMYQPLNISHMCPSGQFVTGNSFVFEHAFLLEKGMRACYWQGLFQIRRLLKLIFDITDTTLESIDWAKQVDQTTRTSDTFRSWTDHFVVLARSYLTHPYVERCWKQQAIDLKENSLEFRHMLCLQPNLIKTLQFQLEGVYSFVVALETLRNSVYPRASLLKQQKIMPVSLNTGKLLAHAYACLSYAVSEYGKSEHKTISAETHSDGMVTICRRILRYAQFSYFTNIKLDHATAEWCLIRIPDTMFVEERVISRKNIETYGNGQSPHPATSIPNDVVVVFGGDFDKGTAEPPKLDFFSDSNLPSPKVFPDFVFA